MKQQENELNTKIREYEGWSINNTKHHVSFIGNGNKPYGAIHLLCEKELSEVERVGLNLIVKETYNMYKGLDIDVKIFES